MRSGWRSGLGNVRSFVSNTMGGLRGGPNVASWVVAGTLAYFLWVKPSQDLRRQQEERVAAAAAAASDPYRYVEKRNPLPHLPPPSPKEDQEAVEKTSSNRT